MTSPSLWRFEAVGPRALLDAAAEALSEADPPAALSLALFDAAPATSPSAAPAPTRRLELLLEDRADLPLHVAGLRAASGLNDPHIATHLHPLSEQDWVAMSLAGLPPVRAGRFRVRGSHHAPACGGVIDILIEAGQAFGTGHHGTTQGCLLALDALAKTARPAPAPRVLDVGTGSGALAIAAAKLWRARVAATEIDPLSAAVARDNARLNGVADRVTVATAAGLTHPQVRGRCFDLILANILAGPLIGLAPELTRAAAPGARLVLSGLLLSQQRAVLGAYRARGWRLAGRRRRDGWATLIVARAGGGSSRAWAHAPGL